MHYQLSRFLFVTFLIALLAGCGFHLRGMGSAATVLPDDWKSMHLVTNNPNSELTRAIVSRFTVNGVVWTDSKTANYRVLLGDEQFTQRNLTLSSEARAAEFELTMSVRFTVLSADGSIVLPETTATVVKQMENDPRNVVGISEEINLLKQEMRVELSQQVVRRIGFFAASLKESEADPNNVTEEPAQP